MLPHVRWGNVFLFWSVSLCFPVPRRKNGSSNTHDASVTLLTSGSSIVLSHGHDAPLSKPRKNKIYRRVSKGGGDALLCGGKGTHPTCVMGTPASGPEQFLQFSRSAPLRCSVALVDLRLSHSHHRASSQAGL